MASVKEQERLSHFEPIFNSSKLDLMNGSELLTLASKFNRIEDIYREKYKEKLISKKIAVLGSYTTNHLISVMKIFLYRYGISPTFYEGEYDGIAMELMNSKSDIYDFKPDILLLLTYHTDIKDYPPLFASDADVEAWTNEKLSYYNMLWEHASTISGCQVLQTSFVAPIYRPLGNLEVNYVFTPSNCLKNLNMELIRNRPQNVNFIDMDYFASYFGKRKWFDDSNYFMSKQGFSFDTFGFVCNGFSRMIASHTGKIKKCLVLDLDNTLWKGVIGDDGLEGININPSDAVGESFLAFQQYLKKLKDRGVILAVCSKNDEHIAKLPFNDHSDMILSLDDISCFVANWNDKSSNINEIANQLNIGIDSIVFFDDNPVERDIVKQFNPEVEVIDVPEDSSLYVDALDKAMCFEWSQLTKEDISRSDSYIANRKCLDLSSNVTDYDSYLKSLEMKAKVGYVSPMELPRFSQLINKTNQFNLRTKRYTEAAISQMMDKNDNYGLIYISLEDKFSKYGIMSCIIVEKIDRIAFVDTWVMSCRVLQRGLEYLGFNAICDAARMLDCDCVVGEYLPTKKNHMVSELYPDLGFDVSPSSFFSVSSNGAEGNYYRINLDDDTLKNHHIIIEN